MSIDHALGIYNSHNNNKLNKNSKLMSNINPNIPTSNIDLTNILDQDGFYESNSIKDATKITNKSFSPTANFKENIKDDKKYYKQLNVNVNNTNNAYN